LYQWFEDVPRRTGDEKYEGSALSPDDTGKERVISPDKEEGDIEKT